MDPSFGISPSESAWLSAQVASTDLNEIALCHYITLGHEAVWNFAFKLSVGPVPEAEVL